METKRRIRNLIVEALRDHPFLSRRQLELYLHCSGRAAREGLEALTHRSWIKRYNARQPWLHTRSLFALTPKGIAELAQQANVRTDDYARQFDLHAARFERLILMMERVFQIRTLFLWLARDGLWQTTTWDVEVGKFFSAKGKAFWIPFHGAALMRSSPAPNTAPVKQERWAHVVIEFDLRRVPVEKDRERFVQFVIAQNDPRYWDKDKEEFFPILLVVAQDEFRLQDYYTILRSTAVSRQLPMPRAYLTTFGEMLSLRSDNTRPIWYSTISGARTSLLFDAQGITGSPLEKVSWRKLPLGLSGEAGHSGVMTPEFPASANVAADNAPDTKPSMASIALSLGPLEKRLLDEIAAHPLLTAKDLAVLVKGSMRRIRPGIRILRELKLVELVRDQYLVAKTGLHYLALIAGFGNAIQRYARARGWGKGFETLVKHWEHTREENAFFLNLATIAQRQAHTLIWLSELESRLYYAEGNRRHSFLPDGRGSYIAGDERYEFALEIDRSRMSREKLQRKFNEYAACILSNVLRGEGIELLRLLVVTTSWERAEMVRRTALPVANTLPMFITTFDRLRVGRVDEAIWLKVEESPQDEQETSGTKTYCFDCFRPTHSIGHKS